MRQADAAGGHNERARRAQLMTLKDWIKLGREERKVVVEWMRVLSRYATGPHGVSDQKIRKAMRVAAAVLCDAERTLCSCGWSCGVNEMTKRHHNPSCIVHVEPHAFRDDDGVPMVLLGERWHVRGRGWVIALLAESAPRVGDVLRQGDRRWEVTGVESAGSLGARKRPGKFGVLLRGATETKPAAGAAAVLKR